jgi:uncharacterized membrane protein YedE/YeeE
MTTTLAPLLIGFAFGWVLQKAGLSHYDRIVNVFRFRDLAVLKFLLSALVTAAIGLRVLTSLGIATDVPIPATYLVGNLIGGVVFGIGMALSGFCPGTVAAGAGEGRLDYLVPGVLGLYVGAVIYGLAYDRVMPSLARWSRIGAITFAEMLRAEPWLVVALFVEVVLLVFYVIERRPRARRAPPSSARP